MSKPSSEGMNRGVQAEVWNEPAGLVGLSLDGSDVCVAARITRAAALELARKLVSAARREPEAGPSTQVAPGLDIEVEPFDEGTPDGCVLVNLGEEQDDSSRILVTWTMWTAKADEFADVLREVSFDVSLADLVARTEAALAESRQLRGQPAPEVAACG